MALFRYKALNGEGELLDGQMEAGSEAEVVARLQEQGHLPVETRAANADEPGPGLRAPSAITMSPYSAVTVITWPLFS